MDQIRQANATYVVRKWWDTHVGQPIRYAAGYYDSVDGEGQVVYGFSMFILKK